MHPNVTLETSETDHELVTTVADRLTRWATTETTQSLALSGGRITPQLFQEIVNFSRQRNTDWSRTEWFWADERCVPCDHGESNYRVAQEHLLTPLQIRADRIHALCRDANNVNARKTTAAQATKTALRILGPGREFDLVLLGMGEDGHIASLFPGLTGEAWQRDSVYLVVEGPKPPPWRITLTLETLKRAKAVWVIVSGPDKAAPLERALAGDCALPLARLLTKRPNTQVFTSVRVRGKGPPV